MSLSNETSSYDNSESEPLVKDSATRCRSLQNRKWWIYLSYALPILSWLPSYNLNWLQHDIIAGLTVGLTVLPQGLAYAQIAGVPLEYGLYTALMGGFVYCILGTSKDITLGPTAIISLFVHTYGNGDVVQVIILTLLGGCIQFVMGILRLGFIMRYLSHPVISGFTSAAAITIGFGQLKHLLGIKVSNKDNFVDEVVDTFKNIGSTNIWDLVMGSSCIFFLVLLRFINKNMKQNYNETKLQKYAGVFLWLISTAKNAVIVLCSAAVAYAIHTQHVSSCKNPDCFTLTGTIEQGLPPFKPPAFSETRGNTTVTAGEFVQNIGIGLVVVPLMGFLESIAIGKAFARKDGYEINVNQEMIAIGMTNIIGSFVSAYTVTGSFSRTAINNQSKVKTPAGGIFTGLLVILGLLFLTPMFYYIPKSALAAVIISAVVFMIDFDTIRQLWIVKKLDLVPLVVTFLVCFWYIPYGIIAGIVVSLLILLYPVSFPKVTFTSFPTVGENSDKELLIVFIQSGINFPCVEHISNQIRKKIHKNTTQFSAVILDFQHIATIDFTATQTLCELALDLEKVNSKLSVASCAESIKDSLVAMAKPGPLSFYKDITEAVTRY